MFSRLNPWRLVFTCGLLLIAAGSAARAQEAPSIQWRSEYSVARKESEAKNLPLLIYFTRPACVYCDKMEASTYRDVRVIGVLNEKVIPLKINAQDQPQWVTKLNVTLFPTLILARPDGHYETLVGYQEADVVFEKNQRLHTELAPPDTMQRDYDNALRWEGEGKYVMAISTLKNILVDGKDRPIQKNAQDLLKKIEKRAEDSLADAAELQAKGKGAEALDALDGMIAQFPGLKASIDASDLRAKLVRENGQLKVEQRNKRARDLLAQAREFYKNNEHIPCLDRCEVLVANFGDLPEGGQAFALASEIKNNRAWMQAAADVMTDRLGNMYLALADSHLKANDTSRAREALQRVVLTFPGSRFAESAQIRLQQLQPTSPSTQNARP